MQKIFKYLSVLFILALSVKAVAFEELGSDPRIRTIVYGKNDVFRVNAIFGYQTVVEFQEDERVQTISVGNPNIFRIVPSRNKLFIKAYQNGQLTNMTLITNKRMYQFELTSNADNVEDMMYLVRFIYPDDLQMMTTGNSAPMDIYSPISLPKSTSQINMPGIPSTNNLVNMPSAPPPAADDVPLSIQYRSPAERRGMSQSPIKIEAPKIIGPLGSTEVNYNNKQI